LALAFLGDFRSLGLEIAKNRVASDQRFHFTADPPIAMNNPLIPDRRAGERAFTLVELLVVVTIIAVLAGISIPAYQGILKKMTEQQARTMDQTLVNSISSYFAEYNKYPLPADYGSEVGALRTDEQLTGALLATDPLMNPKRIRFLPDLKDASTTGKNGLKTSGDVATVVDPWGEEYYVIMDADYNGEIENPNPGVGSLKLYQKVLVYSAGPDKDGATWEDNVTSWTTGKASTAQNQQPTAP
jgi:prepilin-type N-terminal cleavage/methylation domain-containing protein